MGSSGTLRTTERRVPSGGSEALIDRGIQIDSLQKATPPLEDIFIRVVRESQQTAMVASLSAVIPLLFIMPILAQPNGTLARILSYVPLTAPVTIVLRIGATRVPWWDILLSASNQDQLFLG